MRYALLIFTAIAFMACTKEDTTGMFSFGIANDADISIVEQPNTDGEMGSSSNCAQTRAGEDINADNFIVLVTNNNDATILINNAPYSQVKGKYFPGSDGTYTATAESCSEDVARSGYGLIRLYGSSQFSLSAGVTENVIITCSVSNSKVSVNTGAEFLMVYDQSRTKITLSGDSRSLEFNGTGSQNAYYPSGSNVYIKIECYKIGESTKETFNIATPITTQAATWHKLTINATLANAPAAGTGITVDVNSVKLTVNNGIGINPYNPGNGVAEDE